MVSENLIIMHYIDIKWMDLKTQQTEIMAVAVLPATTQNSQGSDKQYSSEKMVILYVLFLHITSF